MIRAIAIDDEPLALQIIAHYCAMSEDIELVQTFTSTSKALQAIAAAPPDLIFLDVNMPEMSGIQFYQSLKNPPPLVFTTAYHEYAVDGFDLNALDYLLKPISKERFDKAVEKVLEYYLLRNAQSASAFLFIRCDHSNHKVYYDEILYIEALDDYVKIYRKNKPRLVARASLKNMLTQLPENQFIRVHRSFVVNTSHLDSIAQKSIQIGGSEIPIGDTYKQNINKNQG
jgi:DNA-binding LytR/AlgR family response regulator